MGPLKEWVSRIRRARPAPSGTPANPEPFEDQELASRFPDKQVSRFTTAKGTYLLPTDAPKDIIVQTIRNGGIFESEIVDLGGRHIVPGTVVLDVGSNFGQMGIEFARFAGPKGKVHCFEANDFVFEILKRNLALNGAANAIPHYCAVWDKSGELVSFPEPDFKRFASYGSYGLSPGAKATKQVSTLKIDDVDTGGRVSFIKVDIQGSDIFALRGAKETILRDKPVIVYEFEAQFQKEFSSSFADYKAFTEEIGYEVLETINKINFVIGPKKTGSSK